MPNNEFYHYFVEGDCEKKFIDAFKTGKYAFLKPGKVDVINPVNAYISSARIRSLRQNTTVVLVYDVDKGNIDILKGNIERFKQYSISKIIHVQSIMNFEDEIIYSTNLKTIDSMFGTIGTDNFKAAFVNHKNICSKLKSVNFGNLKMWSRTNSTSIFKDYSKSSYLKLIRIIK